MIRSGRALRVGLAVLGLAGPAAASPVPVQGLAFVLNSRDASISLLDLARRREIRREPVLREPHHITLAPDGALVLVGDTAANQMLFLDPHSGAILRRQTISDPYQLMFSPDGRTLTVTALARNQVDIYAYHPDGLVLLHRISAPSMPSHVAYAPDSSVAYVTLQESGRVMAIGVGSGAVLWDAKVGRTPAGIIWNRGQLLVGLMGEDRVAELDPADGRVEGHVVTGRGAHNLFFSPDGRRIYVTNRVDGTITALDRTTLRPLRTYPVPGGPDDIEFAPDGTLWVTQRFAHGVLFLDPVSGAEARVSVGRSPHGIFLNTDRATHRTDWP